MALMGVGQTLGLGAAALAVAASLVSACDDEFVAGGGGTAGAGGLGTGGIGLLAGSGGTPGGTTSGGATGIGGQGVGGVGASTQGGAGGEGNASGGGGGPPPMSCQDAHTCPGTEICCRFAESPSEGTCLVNDDCQSQGGISILCDATTECGPDSTCCLPDASGSTVTCLPTCPNGQWVCDPSNPSVCSGCCAWLGMGIGYCSSAC